MNLADQGKMFPCWNWWLYLRTAWVLCSQETVNFLEKQENTF